MLKKRKYYAVRIGREQGIYDTWEECEEQVKGFPNAEYESFNTKEGAMVYLRANEIPNTPLRPTNLNSATPTKPIEQTNFATPTKPTKPKKDFFTEDGTPKEPYAFVDGSFNSTTGVYGYGGFLCTNGKKFPLFGNGDDPQFSAIWNVAGEISGAMAAVRTAMELGLEELTILYDYIGVEAWATGEWGAKTYATMKYQEFIENAANNIKLNFFHVKGHSGVAGNEVADIIAKMSVGAEVSYKQMQMFNNFMRDNKLC